VQVEVTSVDEAVLAIEAGVTDLLLDNFTPDALRAALVVIDGRAAVEASGGITLATARAYAEAGADRLAVGALTHSAPALDLALDVVEVTRGPTPPPSVAAATPPATSAAAPADVPSGDAAASSDWEG
jgi:DNA-binding response OmpR family regulator